MHIINFETKATNITKLFRNALKNGLVSGVWNSKYKKVSRSLEREGPNNLFEFSKDSNGLGARIVAAMWVPVLPPAVRAAGSHGSQIGKTNST